MKTRVSILVISLAAGLAIAQDAQQQPPAQPQQATPPQTQTKTDTKAANMGTPAAGTPAEMKTTTFKGVLVDMSCASGASSAAAPAGGNSANSGSRTAEDSGANCPVSANSSQLGMKLNDGRTVKFDLVGNQRAQDALKNDKHWSKDVSDGKPIHATVSGVLNGEKLIVSSIH